MERDCAPNHLLGDNYCDCDLGFAVSHIRITTQKSFATSYDIKCQDVRDENGYPIREKHYFTSEYSYLVGPYENVTLCFNKPSENWTNAPTACIKSVLIGMKSKLSPSKFERWHSFKFASLINAKDGKKPILNSCMTMKIKMGKILIESNIFMNSSQVVSSVAMMYGTTSKERLLMFRVCNLTWVKGKFLFYIVYRYSSIITAY